MTQDVPPEPIDPRHDTHAQKSRTGLRRLWHATGYSLNGLRLGWGEAAFRLEAQLAIFMLPLAFWLGTDWVEVSLLTGSVLLVLIVELLNTAIETVVDRVGMEWHELSKRAKDMGSAAVLISTILCGSIWLGALFQHFYPR